MDTTSRTYVAGFLLLLLCPALPRQGEAAPGVPMRSETLAVRAAASGRCHHFRVEMAEDVEQRTRGLSHRRTLSDDAGMLFDFGASAAAVTMWMKDTYLPLDMLFIRTDGTVARIEHDTRPHSLERIASGEPVRAVLEINAGLAGEFGLQAGDRVVHPMFPGAARYCVGG